MAKTKETKKASETKKKKTKKVVIENKEEAITHGRVFKLEGIDYVPYVLGWILGVFNLIFWIIILIAGLASENRHRFIDYTLHKIVYIYGIVMIIFILIVLAIIMLLLMLGVSLFWPMAMMYR